MDTTPDRDGYTPKTGKKGTAYSNSRTFWKMFIDEESFNIFSI
jgi:hypothetical protein